ncbi:MAG: amidohydrolase family protein [bacterium]|nr:amidohydrolase family protein [bacterium]
MGTDLERHIQNTPLCDTHEHLKKEAEWVENGPDILQDLFGNYVPADLHSAGASGAAMKRLMDASDPDVAGRFNGIREAWEAVQFTGYGEAVRLIAEEVYGLPELTPEGLVATQEKQKDLRKPGERYRLLHEKANLDHVQVDDFCWACVPDESGPEFFMYDLSWAGFCGGSIDFPVLAKETGVEVVDLASLRKAMGTLFEKYGPCAIAVKAQHAYGRTLKWEERDDVDAARALDELLRATEGVPEATRLCLGDWCWARGVELAIEYNLPFKLHTGYYAGNDRMPVDRIRSGNLCGLLARYLDARFVLMHIAYPYNDEIVALAKHYSNVWVDLCWAWSIDPYSSGDFVRRFLHTAPLNKLFAFGGDTGWPTSSAAYAIQARRWLTRALEKEVVEGDLTEPQAMAVATRLMLENQKACFDLEGTRAAIRKAMVEKEGN